MLKHLIDFSTLAHNLLLTDLEFFGFWPVRSELIIWAHQWGKTACDSLSYRSEHNEEDTAINPPTHSPPAQHHQREKKKYQRMREKGRGGGHIINTNTPLNYFKRDFGQFVGLVLRGEKSIRGSKYVWGAENKQVQMIQSATCILNGGVQCGVEAFFLCQSHNMPLLSEHHGEFSLSFPRNRLLLPMLQSKHKTFSCVIVSQSPKYCSVLSPRQINHEKTASVCFLITSSCPHKHSEMFLNSLWKGDRIYPLHQIEMISTRVCVPNLAYRSDVASEENTAVLPPRGWGCKESSKAVISLRASLACCTFELNQCAFSSDHGNWFISVCRFQTKY